MFNQDDGEATILASVVGAVAAGSPLVAGVILTSDNVAGASVFIITLMVGLVSVGTGIGKLFGRWKSQLQSDLRRDDLLCDLVERVSRIEQRQMKLIQAFEEKGQI